MFVFAFCYILQKLAQTVKGSALQWNEVRCKTPVRFHCCLVKNCGHNSALMFIGSYEVADTALNILAKIVKKIFDYLFINRAFFIEPPLAESSWYRIPIIE